MMRTDFEKLGTEIHQSQKDADVDFGTAFSKSSYFDNFFFIEDEDLNVLTV